MVSIIRYFAGYTLASKWLEHKTEYFEGPFHFLPYVFTKLIHWRKISGDMKAYIIVLVSLASSPGNTCLDCNRRYPKRPNKRKQNIVTFHCTQSNIQNRSHKIVSPCRGRKRPNKENKDAILFCWIEGDILLRKRTCSWCFLFVFDIVSKRPPLETDMKWKVEWTGQNSLNVCRPVKTGKTKIIIR